MILSMQFVFLIEVYAVAQEDKKFFNHINYFSNASPFNSFVL